MIWLSWRQFRSQAIAAAGLTCLLAIALVPTGAHLASLYAAAGLSTCHTACGAQAVSFLESLRHYRPVFVAGIAVLYLVPALIGMFWGAPLVSRELESGTIQLAWNQSVPRDRWIVVKLAVIGTGAVAITGLLSLMITWWGRPVDAALALTSGSSGLNRMDPTVFAARGIVPLGCAVFAFALGVSVGILLRRTVPAMAVTLALFAAVQILVPAFVQPHLVAPQRATSALQPGNLSELMIQNGSSMVVTGNPAQPGAWILSDETITSAGRTFTGPPTQACLGNSLTRCDNWLASQHLRQVVTYEPASRYWALQWAEVAVYLALAAVLGGLSVWLIRRRRS